MVKNLGATGLHYTQICVIKRCVIKELHCVRTHEVFVPFEQTDCIHKALQDSVYPKCLSSLSLLAATLVVR